MTDYGTLLRDHVTLRCQSIDRIFLQAYVPRLQAVGDVCTFLRWQRKYPIPSSAAFGRIGDAYVKAVYRFAEANHIPVVHFKKGEKKEETARPYLEAAAREGKDRVVLIGIAQEKASVWKSWPRKGQEKASHPHMDWGREMAYINHFYFYLWDSEWGAAFWKTNAYAPWPIWLWLNGHEWAKRQLEKAGIAYEALDNGFRSCRDAAALHKICERLGPGAVQSFFGRWWRRLPSPFTDADVRAGYGYQMSFRQFEIADTCVFDRPPAGRMWFEGVIRDHLDVGRPDQIMLIFHRRVSSRTPGTFRTRVISRGVDPTLCCYYKSSRVKQYFKEGRALRTVICNPDDFDNWPPRLRAELEGSSGNPPTGVYVTPKRQTRSPPPTWPPFVRSPNHPLPMMVSMPRTSIRRPACDGDPGCFGRVLLSSAASPTVNSSIAFAACFHRLTLLHRRPMIFAAYGAKA